MNWTAVIRRRKFPKVGEPGYGVYCAAMWRRYALWFWLD